MNTRRTADEIRVSEYTRVKDTGGRWIFEKKNASCRWNAVSTDVCMKLRLRDLCYRYLARRVNRNTWLVSVPCVEVTAWSGSLDSTYILLWQSPLILWLRQLLTILNTREELVIKVAVIRNCRYWGRVPFVHHSKVSEVCKAGVHNSRAPVRHGVYITYGGA
jgi:hypothetical protein